MPTLYIASTFSPGMLRLQEMLKEGKRAVVFIETLSVEDAKKVIEACKKTGYEIKSCIGHQSTASLLSQLLGVNLEVNRVPVTLENGDAVLCLQLMGRPGKELGVTELLKMLEECKAFFILVHVYYTVW